MVVDHHPHGVGPGFTVSFQAQYKLIVFKERGL